MKAFRIVFHVSIILNVKEQGAGEVLFVTQINFLCYSMEKILENE